MSHCVLVVHVCGILISPNRLAKKQHGISVLCHLSGVHACSLQIVQNGLVVNT